MDSADRLRLLIDTYKMSARGFAIKCGIPQQTFDGQLKRKRAVGIETISAIAVTFPEVSRDWLLLGEGEMLNKPNAKESERVNLLLDTIATLQKSLNAKEDAIVALNERIAQLETQLKSK